MKYQFPIDGEGIAGDLRSVLDDELFDKDDFIPGLGKGVLEEVLQL